MSKVEYQNARRLPSLWILYKIVHYIKQFIIFFIFVTILNSDSIFMQIVEVGVIFLTLYNILFVFFDWLHFKYYFTTSDLYIQKGRFFVKERIVPLERIQSINKHTPLFHRLFGYSSFIFNTGATGDESSIKLEMLGQKEIDRIQKHLNSNHFHQEKDHAQDKQISKDALNKQFNMQTHFEMTWKDILIYSLTNLEFIVLIPVLQEIYSDMNTFLPMGQFLNTVVHFFQRSIFLTVIGITATLILLVTIGFLVTYIQYKNFKVTSDKHRIYIQKGMIEQSEFSLLKENIHSIQLNTGLVHRLLGLVRVKVITIGRDDVENEEMKSDILFPFINKKRALKLIHEILPNFYMDTEMEKLPRSSIFIKLIRPNYFWVITTFMIYFFWQKYWYLSLILLVLIVISRFLETFYSCYSVNGSVTQIQKGGLNTKLFITDRKKIVELKVTESWLQQIFNLSSLKVSIQSKPINKITLKDIPKDASVRYYQWYRLRDFMSK